MSIWRSKTAHASATNSCCDVAACSSSRLAFCPTVCSATVACSTRCSDTYGVQARKGRCYDVSLARWCALRIAMTCPRSLHVHPCTHLHPLSPMTKNTTSGNQSLDYVVTTTLANASRSFLLKKKWEAFRYHVASRWVFFGYRGDQQAGSSQTPTIGFVTYRFCVLCVHQAPLPCPLGMPKSGCCQAYLPWLLGEGASP